ncbi:MAG TPA: RNase adapter RapZ [Mariprofundaceae bacterium]|nr:RNase adapter RapZ [Mariprofundaceae bacterium]
MLLISGLSGAGKSTVLHVLEDAGFFCTDNLPLEMLRDWAAQMRLRKQPAAVCIDARSSSNPAALHEAIEAVLLSDTDWRLLFVEANDVVLQRRFSSLKRRHPFAPTADLMQAIQGEREALSAVRERADMVLDTSSLSPYELAERVENFWRRQAETRSGMRCTLMSFSYLHGIPADADMVIDVRFLPNPHYQPELAPFTGRDQPVIDFFAASPEMQEAEAWVARWLEFAWPKMVRERKQYFTLAFGCTGGRHRSVYLAERLADWLRRQGLSEPAIRHRELDLVIEGAAVASQGGKS